MKQGKADGGKPEEKKKSLHQKFMRALAVFVCVGSAASVVAIDLPAPDATRAVLKEQGLTPVKTGYAGMLSARFNCPVKEGYFLKANPTTFDATTPAGENVRGVACYKDIYHKEVYMNYTGAKGPVSLHFTRK